MIPKLLTHLDPSAPFHASTALTALISLLDRVMSNPAESSALASEINPTLENFKAKASKLHQNDLLAQLDKLYEKIERNEIMAILKLGDEKPPGAFENLQPFLNHPDLNHQQTAIVALGRLGDQRALEPLEAIKKNILEKFIPAQGKFRDPNDENTLEYIENALTKLRIKN